MFQSLFDLEIAIEIGQVHKRFIKLPITLLFWHDVLGYKVFGLKFSLYLEGSRPFRLLFVPRKGLNLLDKEKYFCPKTL